MSIDWTDRVWVHSRQGGSAKLLLLALAQVADDDGSTTTLNMPALVQLVGTKERNIQTLLTKLETAGELRREFGVGRHGRTRYILLHPAIEHQRTEPSVQSTPPVQSSAPLVNPGAPVPHVDAPSTGATQDTSLRKERMTEGGDTPARQQTDDQRTPGDEPPLPAAPFVLWQTARATLQPLDEAQLCALDADLDASTNGFGSYWLGRAILAASMTDPHFSTNPRALNLVRAILQRWKREGSYGSDTPNYHRRQEQPDAYRSPIHERLDVARRHAAGEFTPHPTRAARSSTVPSRATSCTIIGLHTDSDG